MDSLNPDIQRPACPPKPLLGERELLTARQAGDLVAIFKTLANDTRLRMLHALVRAGEMCVSEMADLLAMKPQAISNQLTRLADRGIVGSRRNGNNIYYRIVDPCVIEILNHGLCLSEEAKARR
jgi:DNA-binding transcriptional ArsR family regulator